MNKNVIRRFAVWARRELVAKITMKAEKLGLKVESDKLACVWLMRLAALRFMEINGYLSNNVLAVSNADNVVVLANSRKILSVCNSLNRILPDMFQKSGDYTEQLLPDNICEKDGIIDRLVSYFPENDWKNNVQMIGWMYQYFSTELREEIIEGLKKNIKVSKKKIAVATQIFTPDWIVRYMVENSLGKFWLEAHPEQDLKKKWNYYLAEAEQNNKIATKLRAIRNISGNLRLEDIKCIDPCMGCGHILCYVFDLLMQIYEENGYCRASAVESILKNNIYGLDIDENAVMLARFSIMMKARQYDEHFFERNIKPNLFVICESDNISEKIIKYFHNDNKLLKSNIELLCDCMQNACEFGALLSIPKIDFNALYKRIDEIHNSDSSKEASEAVKKILPLIRTAEILAKKYEIVITNPPYMGTGGMNQRMAEFLKVNFPVTKSDLFSAFMEQGLKMTAENGFSCMVTMQNWMFIPSFEAFRRKIIDEYSIVSLLHMENLLMGIAFGTAVSVIRNTKMPEYAGNYNYVKFFDVVDEKPVEFPITGNRFAQIASDKFKLIPGSPIAYWASAELLDAYKKGVIGDKFDAVVGIQTGNNDRFLRYWFEVPVSDIDFNKNEANGYKKRWYPHPKGGSFRKWYGNYDYVVNWQNNGEEIKAFNEQKISIKKYNKDGICWSHTTNGAFSARLFFNTSIPNLENPVLFCDGRIKKYLMALLNTNMADYLLNMINSTMHYHVSDVLNLPLIVPKDTKAIEKVCDDCIELAKADWNSSEFSWDFKKHPLCCYKDNLLAKAYKHWYKDSLKSYERFISNEEWLNNTFIKLYGLQNELSPKIEERHVTVRKPDKKKDIKSFLSYAVGCIFGRYSLDCEGLVYSGDCWKADKYCSFIPVKDNIVILNGNESYENDIISRLEEFLSVLCGKKYLENNLNFIAEAISENYFEPADETHEDNISARDIIRNYFLKSFFKDHCKLYQKRPVYWLFDSGKKQGIKCLVYIHRYNYEVIETMLKDYIQPMQHKYSDLINDCQIQLQKLRCVEKQKMKKTLKNITETADELESYKKNMMQINASKININLNDGIKHNYALFQTVLAKI